MKSSWGIYLPSWQLVVEGLVILLAAVAVGWLCRSVRRWRLAEGGPITPVHLKAVLRKVVEAATFPIAWGAALLAAYPITRASIGPPSIIDAAIFFAGLLAVYQALSAVITVWLPRRFFSRFMARLAVAIGLGVLCLRYIGWYGQALKIVNYPFLVIGPASISLFVVIKSAFFVWIIVVAAGRITSLLQNRILVKTEIDPNLSFAVMRFLKYFLIAVTALVVLDTAGVNLSTLAIFGGALGIGIGFGLQNIANNIVSGWILLLDRSVKQGDVITVGDSYGWVVRLGARYIVVRTRDGIEKLIPNASLITSEITNWSHSDRAVRIHIHVRVSYQSDPLQVRKLLLNVAETNPRVLKKPEPNVLLIDFSDNGLSFELRIWIDDPEGGIESVRSALRFEIWKTFQEHGIVIPYPQRELHIKRDVTGEIEPVSGKPEGGGK